MGHQGDEGCSRSCGFEATWLEVEKSLKEAYAVVWLVEEMYT